MRILLIDDSPDTGLLVERCLAPYEVVQAFTLKEASEKIGASRFNLLLIDVQLPDGDGFAFCQSLTTDGHLDHVPKIFLSASAGTSDKVFGLNCGADDYITKPFEIAELRARVDSRLRHQKQMVSAQFSWNMFDFDSDFQRCTFGPDKRDLGLTPTEFRLLLNLARNEGKPLTRKDLVRSVWTSHGMNIETRGVDSHIAHLRKKLEGCPIQIVSIYGKGYSLMPLEAA